MKTFETNFWAKLLVLAFFSILSVNPILQAQTCDTYLWTDVPVFPGGTTAPNLMTGNVGGVGYTLTSNFAALPATQFENVTDFPASYGVPNHDPTFKNVIASMSTLTFDSPVPNPILAINSIGSSGIPQTYVFSDPVDIIWSNAITIDSPTQITSNGGDAIVRYTGTYTTVTFQTLNFENSTTLAVGIACGGACDACPGVAPIPTLSQWGLIILGLALLSLGAIFLIRRKRVSKLA